MPENLYATDNADFERLLTLGFSEAEATQLVYMKNHVNEQTEYREMLEEQHRVWVLFAGLSNMTAWKNSWWFSKQGDRASHIEACTVTCFRTDVGGWVRAKDKPNSVPASPFDHTGSNHLSRATVTWRLQQPTRELTDEQSASVHRMHTIPSAWSCSGWGLPSQPVTWLLVSSYLTISPLPDICNTCHHYIS